MASKRSYADISSQGDSDDSVECQLPESEKPNHAPKPKKQRPQKSNKYSRSMTQYDSSQQSFLPLYESDDSAIEDHSGGVISAEAATYLRGVRSEAHSLPAVFIAPGTSNPFLPTTGKRYFDREQAFIAPVPIEQARFDEEPDYNLGSIPLISAQDAYHALLISRFTRIRITNAPGVFHSTLPALPWEKNKTAWMRQVTRQPPALTSMLAGEALDMVRVLTLMLRHAGRSLTEPFEVRNTGAWIWVALAYVGERGTLDGDEISVLRELGKCAATLAKSKTRKPDERKGLKENKMRDRRRRNSSSSLSSECSDRANEGRAESVEHHGSMSLDQLESSASKVQAIDHDHVPEPRAALLDMILTIVGESYGQRDLLGARGMLWS